MESIAVIGDIHGNCNTLIELCKKIKEKHSDIKIYSVGDIVDRGPKSAQAIEYIIENNISTVLGNHEEEMIVILEEYLNNIDISNSHWYVNWGGKETIESYHNDNNEVNIELIKKHLNWLKTLPYYIETDILLNGKKIVISHANCQAFFDKKEEQNLIFKEKCIWNREFNFNIDSNILNIFGHTPVIYPFINDFIINIDTGCFITKYKNKYSILSSIIIPEMEIIQQKNIDTMVELSKL